MTAPLSTAPARRRPASRPAETGPDLHVVGRPRRDRPVGLIVAATVIVLFGALFLNAIFHSILVSGQARLDGLNQSVSQAETSNQQRRLKVATLESPGRIVHAAKAAGMVQPDTVHWVMPAAGGGAPVTSTSARVTPQTVPTDPGAAELAAGPDATVPADR